MASFRKPQESAVPARRRPRPSANDFNEEATDYGSEAASRFEPASRRETHVPVAYPVAEVAPVAENVRAFPVEDDDVSEEPEMSEFAESQFMNSEFNESHMGTEYSTYKNSEFAGEDAGIGGSGSASGSGDRLVGTREWARQQQSQNSSQFTADTADASGPWTGVGRDASAGGNPRRRRAGDGRAAAGVAGEDGRMHDLPPMPDKNQHPTHRSVLSHDLSGFSDFDPVAPAGNGHQRPGRESSSGSGGVVGGDITAPHPAPSDRDNWNRMGMTAAAAAAADADARNLARQQQREREAAERAERRAAKKAAAVTDATRVNADGSRKVTDATRVNADGSRKVTEAMRVFPDGSGKHELRRPSAPTVRDVGDLKEEEASEGGTSAFRASTVEALQTHGDPYDDRPINQNGTTGEYALATTYHLIFTPLMFLICLALLFWEFALNGWVAESLSDNPSYGPSVETLIEAGAKRTDLIVDGGDWWRIISPMFLHAGVVHFLFNMLGFLQVGAMVERDFGWWRVGTIYLLAGIFGTIASAIFVPTQVMVGASGAIFGVFGAMWADLWQNWSINQNRCWMFTVLLILTVANIILGLFPFLDNFAHIGGMLMGFLVGLGLLVQKREDDFGSRLDKKCYQMSLQLVAAIAVPTLMILGLSLLYGRSDPSEWCGWCENISCVEFPADDPWWPCDDCNTIGFEAEKFSDGTITISCPDGTTESSGDCSDESDASLVECCIAICL